MTHQNHWLQLWPWVPFLALSGETLARSWSPGSVTVLAMNHWLLNKFTIEESFCKKKYWRLQNHKLFTHFHGEITGCSPLFTLKSRLSFFKEISDFLSLSVKIALSTTHSHSLIAPELKHRGLPNPYSWKSTGKKGVYLPLAISSFMCVLGGSIFAQ